MLKTRLIRLGSAAAALMTSCAHAQERLHFTYLWHLEQRIYWPERQVSGTDRYQRAWETIQLRDSGAPHPQNDLRGIVGLDDRKAVYQYRVRDCISAKQRRWWHPAQFIPGACECERRWTSRFS